MTVAEIMSGKGAASGVVVVGARATAAAGLLLMVLLLLLLLLVCKIPLPSVPNAMCNSLALLGPILRRSQRATSWTMRDGSESDDDDDELL